MKFSISKYIALGLAAFALSSCAFKNEMAYPRIFAEITGFKVENEKVPTEIDKRNMRVNVVLNERADLKEVKLLEYTHSEGVTGADLPEILDLTEPVVVEMKNYHTYKWTIVGKQPVERYVECDGAASPETFKWMPELRQAQIFLLKTTDLKKVHITDMKLGLEGSEIISTSGHNSDGEEETQPCEFPMDLDCSFARTFIVEYKGEQSEWTLEFAHMQMKPTVTMVFPRCWHAGVMAEYDGVGEVRMEYSKSGADDWKPVEKITVNETRVTADIPHLKAGTEYEVRLVQGETPGDPKHFKTGKPDQLDNMSFENWTQTDNVWYPSDGSKNVWSTANKGVVQFIGNTTVPDYKHSKSGAASAKMVTDNAVVALAAGNLFTGQFGRMDGTTAILYWGTPFTARPSKLIGWYDYSPRTITGAKEKLPMAGGIKNPYFNMNGKMDRMQLMVALIAAEDNEWKDKGAYKVISTKPGTPQLNPELPDHDPRVIAFGELISDNDTNNEFHPFELKLKYYDDREPAYVIVVACSSAYGNFFTGAVGSQLYVDDFKFIYE